MTKPEALNNSNGGGMGMTRDEAFNVVVGERRYQQSKWNPEAYTEAGVEVEVFNGQYGPEAAHPLGDFVCYMEDYLAEARNLTTRYFGNLKALDTLRKVVALGGAAFEQHGGGREFVFRSRPHKTVAEHILDMEVELTNARNHRDKVDCCLGFVMQVVNIGIACFEQYGVPERKVS